MATASTTSNKPRDRAVKGAVAALCLLTAMNFVNYLDRYILPAVQEQIKHEFHLSDSQVGSLTLWFFIAYVLSSPLTGWLGDRFPRKPMIVVAALMIAAMNFWTAGVHSYLSLNLRHAALGIGEASFGIFAPALLADYFADDQRNAVLTIFNVAIPVGAALGYLSGGVVAAHHGWRMAFIVSAIPGALIALLILFFMREPQRVAAKDRKKVDKASVLSLARNKAYLCSIMGYAAVTFSLGGISWWMPSFLNRVDGRSMEAAGTIMGAITVVCGLGGTVVGGVLAVVVEEDEQSVVSSASAECDSGGFSGSALFFWTEGGDSASAGDCGVSDLSGDGAGECGDAECGSGASAGDGDGGTVVRAARVWRCVFAEADWDRQ